MFYLLGYCIFTIICGSLSLSSAKKGNKNPWIPFIVGAVIFVLGLIGSIRGDQLRLGGISMATVIENGVDFIVGLIFFFLIRAEQKKHAGEQ